MFNFTVTKNRIPCKGEILLSSAVSILASAICLIHRFCYMLKPLNRLHYCAYSCKAVSIRAANAFAICLSYTKMNYIQSNLRYTACVYVSFIVRLGGFSRPECLQGSVQDPASIILH